jgi:hypothetical protein
VSDGSGFRTNWYGLNLSEDEDGEPEAGEVMVEVLDPTGAVLASRTFTMPPLAPMLQPVSDLGAGSVARATLRFTMLEGMGAFGASKVDMISNDPTTLESHWDCDACTGGTGETIEMADRKLFIEFNATDEDIGVQAEFDDEGWTELCLFDPNGRQVFSVRPKGALGELGMADFFFESREPELDEFSFDDLKEVFPEGQYMIAGTTFEDETLTGFATFTHDLPEMPEITSPADLVDDPDEEPPPVVPMENLVVSWEPVTLTVDGDPVTITAYEVIVTKEEHEDPNGFSRPVYDVHLPPDRTSLPVPEEFLEPGTLYELEVLALEVSGNQTIGLGFFETAE